MASPGMEFIASLNSSFASSAQTYAKSKAGERAEIQKELDKTDRQINSLTRLYRSTSASRSSRGALGAVTQLLGVYLKRQDASESAIKRDREKVNSALDKLEGTNNGFWEKAKTGLEGASNSLDPTMIKNLGPKTVGGWSTSIDSALSALDDESKVLAYAMILDKVRKSGAPMAGEIEARIQKKTSEFLTKIRPSEAVDDSVDPVGWASRNVPVISPDARDRIAASPQLQQRYLGETISTATDYSAMIKQLEGHVNSYLGAAPTGRLQIPDSSAPIEEKQAFLDKIVPGGALVAGDGDEITINPEAEPGVKQIALDAMATLGSKTYSDLSEAARGLEVQSGRDDPRLESLKSELSELKERRSAQVQALSKAPRLSTGKMALLDHPILRVAGFREAPSMRLLKWKGRQKEAPAAAPAPDTDIDWEGYPAHEATVVAPEAVADEGLEFGVPESPGVYVIPGIVQKFKRQVASIKNAKDDVERENALDALQKSAAVAEGFSDDVKKALGKAYVSIQGYAELSLDEDKGGTATKYWVDSYLKDISEPDREIAESFGTVSDVLSARGSSGMDKTVNLLGFLGDERSLGEGAIPSPGEARDLPETLGSSGGRFYNAFIADDVEGIKDAIASASNAMKVPLGEDLRYGSFGSGFDADRDEETAPPTDDGDEDDMIPEMVKPSEDPEMFATLTAQRAAKDEQKRLEEEQNRLNREFVGQARNKGEHSSQSSKQISLQHPYTRGGSKYKPDEPPPADEPPEPPPAAAPTPAPTPPVAQTSSVEVPAAAPPVAPLTPSTTVDEDLAEALVVAEERPPLTDAQLLADEKKRDETRSRRIAEAEARFAASAPPEPSTFDRGLIAADELLTKGMSVAGEAVEDATQAVVNKVSGWRKKFFDKGPEPAPPVAAAPTPKPEEVRLDFTKMEPPRRQVEAAKIIISKFSDAGLSDEMVKAAIINALAESRMDTFLPAGAAGEKSYGLWHFNQAKTGAGYGIKREDLEDPYWMTDKFIEVLEKTGGRPKTDDVGQLSSWITLKIENPGDAENQAKERPGRYGPSADKIIKEARDELALSKPEA